ncbi:MAG: type II secretion system minor pseudopilin GspK [Gammaproteobacteria bacterium]|uniref:type II secretion system minor pseudopilin GspK n=1 Tax=Pseudacidovorax sp. TaxID=1934311 RepID=UPI001B773FD4|nr:type II secretion system minor pseudopilin GspK [Pseudacidovorax sp.]MBP6895375.1 type II secretion system minor pseudopilin GspK [Pseudacidovorax sp.]
MTVPPVPLRRQRGAALLTALITVTLVATLAAAALWRQWRATEVEAAERSRLQASLVLAGALDWSRLILAEDGRTGGADHLAEPWAVPLAEAKLTSFLAADKNVASDALEGLPDAFLSGSITDAQSRLNLRNLVDASGRPVLRAVAATRKLFDLLDLPPGQVDTLVQQMRRALLAGGGVTQTQSTTTGTDGTATAGSATASTPSETQASTSSTDDAGASEGAPLMPQRVEQLGWLGLPADTVAAIAPYVTLLPASTPVNLNTASAEVIFAAVDQIDMAGARKLVEVRRRKFFSDLAEASQQLSSATDVQLTPGQVGISTSYFEVRGRLRMDRYWVEEASLLHRTGTTVSIIWRQRNAGVQPTGGSG